MKDISFGENELSWEALKLISEIYQAVPFISTYNLALSICSAWKLAVIWDFCRILLSDVIVNIVWDTPVVILFDVLEPLIKNLI